MPKYLAHVSYTVEGLKGLLKDGGTKRREVVVKLAESLGGKLEAFYYALGEDDLFVIFDFPENVSATSASLIVNASGAANVRLTALLTPEEVDQAVKKSVDYSPPGQ
ncbi:MAG: GYD domain-containing protein [Desulfobacterales bacterium]|nr:GYD domain-containing protein [Desulfobacterales bacterium]